MEAAVARLFSTAQQQVKNALGITDLAVVSSGTIPSTPCYRPLPNSHCISKTHRVGVTGAAQSLVLESDVILYTTCILIISALYYISRLEAYMYNRSVHSVHVAAAV
jgi:hypothetical protein